VIVGVVFGFVETGELTLEAFRWSNGFDEEPGWLHQETLPDPQTASFDMGKVVASGATLEIGVVTVTAAEVDAVIGVSLTVFPDGVPSVGFFEGDEVSAVEILEGREVTIRVDPGEGGAGSGGSVPGDGVGGGTDGAAGDGEGDDGSVMEGEEGDVTTDDGADGSSPEDEDGDGGVPEEGTDDAGGDEPSGGAEGANGEDTTATNGDEADDNGADNGAGGLCGFAMAPYALFTVVSLSVMKLGSRRRT
jgi:hypothetical protein